MQENFREIQFGNRKIGADCWWNGSQTNSAQTKWTSKIWSWNKWNSCCALPSLSFKCKVRVRTQWKFEFRNNKKTREKKYIISKICFCKRINLVSRLKYLRIGAVFGDDRNKEKKKHCLFAQSKHKIDRKFQGPLNSSFGSVGCFSFSLAAKWMRFGCCAIFFTDY